MKIDATAFSFLQENMNGLSFVSILMVAIALVVYIAKDQRKQAVDVNSQFLTHMQESLKKEQAIHEAYAASIHKLASSVESNTMALQPIINSVESMTSSVKELSESVKKMVDDHHRDVKALVEDYRKAER